MTYSEINNIQLPELGDNLPVIPEMFNDGIKKLDEMKIQYVNAEYVTVDDSSFIVLDGMNLNYLQIENYCKNKAYQFRIKKDNSYFPLIKIIPHNPLTVTQGNLIFGGIFTNDESLVSKIIIIKSDDGTDISELIYNENDLLNTSNKVTTLNAGCTDSQYPSAKATYDFVTSSVNANAAYYITKNSSGDPFATKAELDSTTTFYSGGVVRVPTRNDYCIISADETHDNYSCRYIYQNNQWEFQYNYEKQFTAAQMQAINSGITAAKVLAYDEVVNKGISTSAMVYKEYKLNTNSISGVLEITGWSKPIYGNKKFISVNTNKVAISLNGKDWSVIESEELNNLISVCYDDNHYIALSNDGKIYSFDISLDTTEIENVIELETTGITQTDWIDISYTNNIYMLFKNNYTATSNDGLSWNENSISIITDTYRIDICNNKFFLIGTNYVYYSNDGIIFNSISIIFKNIKYYDGYYYIIEFNNNKYYLKKSSNLVDWNSVYELTDIDSSIKLYNYILIDGTGIKILFNDCAYYSNNFINFKYVDYIFPMNVNVIFADNGYLISGIYDEIIVYIEYQEEMIYQQGNNITDSVSELILSKDPNTYITGVSGTDYGEPADTFTQILYLWCGDTDPGETIRNQYKNTLFFVKSSEE